MRMGAGALLPASISRDVSLELMISADIRANFVVVSKGRFVLLS